MHKSALIRLFLATLIAFQPIFLLSLAATPVQAAVMTEAGMRFDRMSAGVSSGNVLVFFKPPSTATETQIRIDLSGSDFTFGTVTTSTTGITSIDVQGETLTAVPTLQATCSVASEVITCTTGDLTATTMYGFFITGGLTNGTAGAFSAVIATQITGPADQDVANIGLDIVTSGDDLVAITATVAPTFNFDLQQNSVAFGTLPISTAADIGSTVTIDIDTNAENGWSTWIKSANGALTSTVASGDPISSQGTSAAVSTYSSGAEFYQVSVTVGNGTGTGTPAVATGYQGDGTTTGGTLTTTFTEIATSTGPGADDTVVLTGLAAASAVNPAATDYADTWTLVGAGNF